MEPIKIIIVDDEPIIRKALKTELNSQPANIACGMNDDGEIEYRSVTVLDTYANGAQLMAALDSPATHEMPDYVLVDMEFQGEPTGGIFLADRIHQKYPNIKIAILSGRFDNPLPSEGNRHERMLEIARVVFESLQHGAQAFVSKNAAGGFSVEDALTISRIQALADAGELEKKLLPVDRLFAGNQMCRVSSEEEKKLRCGSSFPTSLPDGDYRVYGESGAFLMLGRAEDGRMHTVKSFFEV